MAEVNHPNIDEIVCVFREIVQRKIVYNETNLHYEYFEKAGDTIPFKTYGYQSLREFIEHNAGEYLYFGECGESLVYIAPRRENGSCLANAIKMEPCDNDESIDTKSGILDTSDESKPIICFDSNTVMGAKSVTFVGSGQSKCVSFAGSIEAQCGILAMHSETSKSELFTGIRKMGNNTTETQSNQHPAKKIMKFVSDNMHFSSPQSTGLCNPFQNVRNDIRVSVDFHANTRAIGHLTDLDEEMTTTDPAPIQSKTTSGKMYFPWKAHYWHLKVTHVVSMNEIWARFFDEFEASVLNEFQCNKKITEFFNASKEFQSIFHPNIRKICEKSHPV